MSALAPKKLELAMTTVSGRGRPKKKMRCAVPGCTQTWAGGSLFCPDHGKGAPKEEIFGQNSGHAREPGFLLNAGRLTNTPNTSEGAQVGRSQFAIIPTPKSHISPVPTLDETARSAQDLLAVASQIQQEEEARILTAQKDAKDSQEDSEKESEEDSEKESEESSEKEREEGSEDHEKESKEKTAERERCFKKKRDIDSLGNTEKQHKAKQRVPKGWINSRVMFSYEDYLRYKDNVNVCNCSFKTPTGDIINIPAADLIFNSSFYADEINSITGPLRFEVEISTEVLNLLIKMLYEKRISDVDIKTEKFFEVLLSAYMMDFTDILNKLLPYTKDMIDTTSFRESFCDYVVGQTASDYYEDVTQFVFKGLDETAIKDVVLGIFLSKKSEDMTLKQRRHVMDLTGLALSYDNNETQ